MTGDDWNRTIDEAAGLGAEEIQLIGGEPTPHPAFARMPQRAVGAGLRVRVHSNLLRVRSDHWRLFERPSMRLATTYHSTVAARARRGHRPGRLVPGDARRHRRGGQARDLAEGRRPGRRRP
ncbi:hypothetical protein [Streptomyces viridosporus]|uniref:hypothetical protein n=1 Tax=Streptomyces viridosporus TaxID=67581 RepID=UPI003700650F